jgi:hypothetical protein
MQKVDVWYQLFFPVLREIKKRLESELESRYTNGRSKCLDCVIYLLENLEEKP